MIRHAITRLRDAAKGIHAWFFARRLAQSDLHTAEPYLLLMSHTNYAISIAGTELVIWQQVEGLRSRGFTVMHLFPAFKSPMGVVYGVNKNGSLAGHASLSEVLEFLRGVPLRSLIVHHLFGWSIDDVRLLLDHAKVAGAKIQFFLHDFFALCPTCHVECLAQGHAVCGTAAINTRVGCANLFRSSALKIHRERMREILRLADRVRAPSEIVVDYYSNNFPELQIELRPWLREEGRIPAANISNVPRFRLAFLGRLVPHKGSHVFCEIHKRFRDHYDFVVLGDRSASHPQFTYSPPTGPDRAVAMRRRLLEERIHVALVLSTVPETFSFTAHDALVAGVPMLALASSGNVARLIHRAGRGAGRVFSSKAELLIFLSDRRNIEALVREPRELPRFAFDLVDDITEY